MHTKALEMYGFNLSLRVFKTNIHYNFIFNINNYIDSYCILRSFITYTLLQV
jgi:hypothetical protein